MRSAESGKCGLRVLHFIDGLRVGGKERQLVEVVAGLHEHGQAACGVVSLSDGPLHRLLHEAGAEVHLLSRRWRWDPAISRQVADIGRAGDYNVLHSWDGMTDVYASLAKRLTEIAWVAGSVRGVEGLRSWREWVQRISWWQADVVLSNSWAGLRAYRVGRRQGRVIYNGIDLRRFSASPALRHPPAPSPFTERGMEVRSEAARRESLGIGETDFVVGMVASFSQYKDQPTLIRAAARLTGQGVPLWVIFLGDGPTRPRCEAMARATGCAERFLFLGSQMQPEHLIPLFDVGVLTSPRTGEGCANAVLECLAMEKPVVATAVGGNLEIVDEGSSGYLVGVEDHDSLGSRLLDLYRDPARRASMGERGRQVVTQRFSRERMVRDVVSLYQGLVQRLGRRQGCASE